jgi:hypothetical protein
MKSRSIHFSFTVHYAAVAIIIITMKCLMISLHFEISALKAQLLASLDVAP